MCRQNVVRQSNVLFCPGNTTVIGPQNSSIIANYPSYVIVQKLNIIQNLAGWFWILPLPAIALTEGLKGENEEEEGEDVFHNGLIDRTKKRNPDNSQYVV
jgi:hypothetical protein